MSIIMEVEEDIKEEDIKEEGEDIREEEEDIKEAVVEVGIHHAATAAT